MRSSCCDCPDCVASTFVHGSEFLVGHLQMGGDRIELCGNGVESVFHAFPEVGKPLLDR